MQIDQLRQLIEISKTHSINQAASNLYLSQPNLSLSIKNLETELGCSLILRTNRGVQLTPLGEDFVGYAKTIVDQFDHLRTIGHPSRDPNMAVLSIANMCFKFVTYSALEVFNRHKDDPFHLIIQQYYRDGVIDCVANEVAEIGFINFLDFYEADILKQIQNKGLVFNEMSIDAIAIILGQGNPLFDEPREYMSVAELENYPMVIYDEMDFYHYSDKARLVGISKTAGEITVSSQAEFWDALMNTQAFAISSYNPNHYKSFEYPNKTRHFNINDCKYVHKFGWIMRRSGTLSSLAKECLDIVGRDL